MPLCDMQPRLCFHFGITQRVRRLAQLRPKLHHTHVIFEGLECLAEMRQTQTDAGHVPHLAFELQRVLPRLRCGLPVAQVTLCVCTVYVSVNVKTREDTYKETEHHAHTCLHLPKPRQTRVCPKREHADTFTQTNTHTHENTRRHTHNRTRLPEAYPDA